MQIEQNDRQDTYNLTDLELPTSKTQPGAIEEKSTRLDVEQVDAIKDWKEDKLSVMQRIISQKNADKVLTPGLL